ncbi:DUF1413 domain-containing protein [Achromobacter sp. D10]|uniref:DUF1413 domain-containing protein n=1 Tax=Achromobacter sp. D10 TaxID=3110765 RepID=UPI002B4655D4|nr:DUF1413 domain-containing protein [Achromobacter sp. D10]MEB3099369.1 DUF1413 domain-containing protein [Achromobacter sp. D10]
MNEEAFKELSERAKKAKCAGISSYVLQQFGLSTDDSVAADIVKRTGTRSRKLAIGDVFTMRAMFKAGEWDEFPKAARIKAGRMLQEKLGTDSFDHIKYKGNNGANHRQYQRIRSTADAD